MTGDTIKRPRARRIASDEAHSWARNLRLKNPHAKYVLCMLTLYVNGEGSCFVGASQLADDCELAIETVRKRLAFLEQIGAVARFAQWVDEHGRRNGDSRGRRTSDDIRLLVDADVDAIETRAHDKFGREDDSISPPRDRQQDFTPEPQTDGVQESVSLPTGSLVGVCQPPSYVGGLTLEPEPEPEPESSPYPLRDPLGGLRPFADRYPIPITGIEATTTLWSALSETEQDEVLVACDGYAAFLKANPKRAAMDAHRWLAKRSWVGYLDHGRKEGAQRARVEIIEGSPEWTAWEIYYRCCGQTLPGISPLAIAGKRRAWLASEWPPVGRDLNPDRGTWRKAFESEGQFAAWLRRLREGPVKDISLRTEPIDGKYVRYLLVPCEWPPSKGASESESLMTDEDAREAEKL